MNELLVECRGLTKSYGGKLALNGVDLSLGRGRIVGLLGPNGSGKTTLIKILCGLIQPTQGSATVDGRMVGPYTKSIISYLPDRMYFATGCGRWTCSTCSPTSTRTLTAPGPWPCARAWEWTPRTG